MNTKAQESSKVINRYRALLTKVWGNDGWSTDDGDGAVYIYVNKPHELFQLTEMVDGWYYFGMLGAPACTKRLETIEQAFFGGIRKVQS